MNGSFRTSLKPIACVRLRYIGSYRVVNQRVASGRGSAPCATTRRARRDRRTGPRGSGHARRGVVTTGSGGCPPVRRGGAHLGRRGVARPNSPRRVTSANMGAMHARGLTGAPLRAALAVVLVCVAGAGAACGSTIPPPRVVSDADNGHSVTVRRGAIIRLVLHSTYWRPHGSSAPSVVAVSGAPKYVAQSGGIAGSGNGTVTETLRALTAGRARVSASRLSCGEALRCRPAQ